MTELSSPQKEKRGGRKQEDVEKKIIIHFSVDQHATHCICAATFTIALQHPLFNYNANILQIEDLASYFPHTSQYTSPKFPFLLIRNLFKSCFMGFRYTLGKTVSVDMVLYKQNGNFFRVEIIQLRWCLRVLLLWSNTMSKYHFWRKVYFTYKSKEVRAWTQDRYLETGTDSQNMVGCTYAYGLVPQGMGNLLLSAQDSLSWDSATHNELGPHCYQPRNHTRSLTTCRSGRAFSHLRFHLPKWL